VLLGWQLVLLELAQQSVGEAPRQLASWTTLPGFASTFTLAVVIGPSRADPVCAHRVLRSHGVPVTSCGPQL
jgi:hypothetical protein